MPSQKRKQGNSVRLFLCGDVMLGRGIDQILPHPCDPEIHEAYVQSALDYVRLAERVHGQIPRPAGFDYIWGAALDEWRNVNPDLRIINLETAITYSDAYVAKGINYRISPKNVDCILTAKIDCCCLANNHVLDWGKAGLIETLEILKAKDISMAGAGQNAAEAEAPATIEILGQGRVIIFAFAMATSGTPSNWAATPNRPGVNFLSDLSKASAERIARQVAAVRQKGDIVLISLHWGPNWGYAIPDEHRQFVHSLIDRADISIVHGHSAHHPKAMELYKNRLILYGCGDFLNDYEGITGYENFRGDLSLMYFADVDRASGELSSLTMTPLQIHRFRLDHATHEDAQWLQQRLDRECRPFGGRIVLSAEERLVLQE